ncbi:MAG: hypothetical protein ACOH18_03200 [Candidatus Saccharimonadaceae bacterium]
MSEFPKFYIDETTPTNSPFRDAADAWNDLNSQYLRNWHGIVGVMNEGTSELIMKPKKPGQTYDERMGFVAIRIEETLSEEYPEFTIAVSQLKLALDGIVRMSRPITWNHYQPGEFIALDSVGSGEIEGQDVSVFNVRRAMATFPENTGYLIGHQIGFGTGAAAAMGSYGGYPMWLELSEDQDARQRYICTLSEMYAIRPGQHEDDMTL